MKPCEVPAARHPTKGVTAFGLLALAVFVWEVTATAGALRPPGAPDDPFLCYRVRAFATPRLTPIPTIPVAGPLGPLNAHVTRPVWLCTPADVDARRVVDAATALEGYKIQPPVAAVPQRRLQVTNEFGPLRAEIGRPDYLLVP
ncbi:MAG: hypothetical protein E6J56_25600, partial [Deltaproteobacteria bacterium]